MPFRSFMHILLLCLLMPHITWGYGVKPAVAKRATCASNNAKLLSLLNLLCNTTQTLSTELRDACYGCFFRAGNLADGPTKLSTLSECALLYLIDTEYEICSVNLLEVVAGTRPAVNVGGNCYSGYCEFAQCIRRINSQQLIATCYAESLGIRELEEDSDRISFYTNVTSCILAKSRCSQYNPITGELQTNNLGRARNGGIFLKPAIPVSYFNALQIAPNGDIRVFSFPSSINVADLFCARVSLQQQSGFGTINC